MTQQVEGRVHFPRNIIIPKKSLLLVLSIGLIARVIALLLLPANETGSYGDEVSYYRAGLQILFFGEQNLFWPPLTGWLVAFFGSIFNTNSLSVFRLLWCLIDVLNIFLLWCFMQRVFIHESGYSSELPPSFPFWIALVYALYLPAIEYAVHVTSEVPSLLLILLSLLVLNIPYSQRVQQAIVGGVAIGFCILTRSNLAPLVVTMSISLFYSLLKRQRPLMWITKFIALFIVCAALVPLTWVARNQINTGRVFLTLNLLSNAKYGAEGSHAQDLNVLSPTVTQEQVDRRLTVDSYHDSLDAIIARANSAPTNGERERILREELPYQRYSIEEFFQETDGAFDAILDSPLRYISAIGGRFTRLIAPQTNILDFFPREVGLFNPQKLIVFVLANAQWALILFLAVPGLFARNLLSEDIRLLLINIVIGCAVASIFSISEPRYAFPFTFILIILFIAFVLSWKRNLKNLLESPKRSLLCLLIVMALAWAWLAAAAWALNPALLSNW